MAKKSKSGGVGYAKPPRGSRFRRGESGNRKGRPKGSRNFDTVIAEELDDRVPVTENGRRRRISKREAIAKQLINKAANGDLKATQTVINQTRRQEDAATGGESLVEFDTPEHRLVMADIVRRIRLMDEPEKSIG